MKKTWMTRGTALLLSLLFALCAAVPAGAVYDMPISTSDEKESVYLVNLDNGEVLLDQNSTEVRYIASLTKMMTALLVLESGEPLENTVTIPERLTQEFKDIQNANGAGINLRVGEQISLKDLMYGLLVASANDAASVLADHVGGSLSGFVEKMNQRAQELGCTNTTFSCVHGLYDQGNVSTAQDLVKIATACWQDERYREIANTVSYTIPATNLHAEPRELEPTNLMLVPDGEYYRPDVAGVKTGFTTLAGRCYVTTASHEGHNYMLVQLGAKKEKKGESFYIYPEADALLDWLFGRYSDRTLLEQGAQVSEIPLRGCDEAENVTLHAKTDLIQNAYEDAVVEIKVEAPEKLKAPLKEGEELGTAIVTLDGQEVGKVPLVTDQVYESALLKGGKQALLLIPALLVVVAALGYLTAQLGHSAVHFEVLTTGLSEVRRAAHGTKRRRAKAHSHR